MKKLFVLSLLMCCILFSHSIAFADGDKPQKHRIGISAGAYIPSGKYTEGDISLDYNNGGTFGCEYSYMFTEKFGIGAFMDYTSFSSESTTIYNYYKVDLDITTIVLGASAILEHRFSNAIKLYGAGKLGVAVTNIDFNASSGPASASVSDSGSALAAIIEVGTRYPLNKTVDFGVAAKYSYINQSTADGAEHSNLGGLALVALFGINF